MSNDDATRRAVLRTTTGLGAAALGLGSLSGSATAHYPEELDVEVNPGFDGRIDLAGERFAVRVAPNEEHDPTGEMPGPHYNHTHYRAGTADAVATGPRPEYAYRGLFHDGSVLLTFPLADTGITTATDTVRLRWERHVGGSHGLSGTDEVTVE
ncbi:hypothetical protein [Halorarius halobius]|uniref:hypothetical protein n=1 Tax=Halorarius halobius TaxID=2962671 RepID=UPI0020CD42ED|nr:hypothetical protein [Halorarius halobius]